MLNPSSTVHNNDGSVDSLWGKTEVDWFLASTLTGQIDNCVDDVTGEIIN